MNITQYLLSAALAAVLSFTSAGASAQASSDAEAVDIGESKLALTDVMKAADFSSAIKVVKGKPGYGDVMVLITDPQCPYCRSMHNTMKDLDNVTIYVLMVKSLGPKSAEINRKVWCSPNRVAAYETAWSGGAGSLPEASCKTEVIDNLHARLNPLTAWRSVPAMFFLGGRVINGEASVSEIKQEIAMGKNSVKK